MAKYLFKKGTQLILDVHPWSYPYLSCLDVPIIIAESALKADAIISAFLAAGITRFCVISISGVSGWRSSGEPLSDFDDIKKHLRGRVVYIAFDSDAATNPNVIRARWGLAQFLKRKKARVLFIDVPQTLDGDKQGIDDALAAGHDLAAMIASAYPAPDIMPVIDLDTIATDEVVSEIERLRLERDAFEARALRAERHVSLVTKLAVSSLYTANEKILILQSGPLAMSDSADVKREDGTIELDAGKLSNDFRPTDKEHPDYEAFKRSPVNPKGDRWYMRRSSVVPTINSLKKKLGANAPIDAKPDYVRNPGDSSPHRVSIITMKRPDNMIDFLEAVNRYRPDAAPERPYQVQDPCPHCGDVHSRTRRTTCDGCGAETEAPKYLPVPPASDPNATQEQRDELAAVTANPVNTNNLFTENRDISSPSPAPSIRCSENICLQDDGELIDPETGEIIDSESIEPETCAHPGCTATPPAGATRCRMCTTFDLEEYDRRYGSPADRLEAAS